MIKSDIAKRLRQSTGQDFITATQLAKAFGMSSGKLAKRKFLTDLEAVEGKYYLIDEVAGKIKERCEL